MTSEFQNIETLEQFNKIINQNKSALIYFSHEQCSVCKVFKPKVVQMINEKFEKTPIFYVDVHKSPEIAGQNTIFAMPTILVFFNGLEQVRKTRVIGISELSEAISRPYNQIFE